jgi:hypothetical protein
MRSPRARIQKKRSHLIKSQKKSNLKENARKYPSDKNYYLIEFADLEGFEYAMATLTAEEILVLNYELSVV